MTTPPLSAQIRQAVQSLITAGQSQSEIARRAGIRQPPLSQWLNGKKKFSEDALDRLAEVAGVRLVTLRDAIALTYAKALATKSKN